MNTKMLNTVALGGSILIFIAAFLAAAVNGAFTVTVLTAGGIWYLIPLAGLSGIVLASMALAEKVEIKVPALVIGGLVLVLGIWFATYAASALDQVMAMQNDISKGFASSFFSGQPQDTSNIPKSSFGLAFYMNLIGSIMLLATGLLVKNKEKVEA